MRQRMRKEGGKRDECVTRKEEPDAGRAELSLVG